MLLESNPHLRQHAAGRRAVRRRVAVFGGQAAHRRAARRVRHRLHRGRLSCVESQGHRLLPARAHHAAQACAGGRVRLDLQEGRGGRRRPGLGRPAGKQGPRGHHRGEDVGRTGHARAADHARGEPAHDRRLGGPPERPWPARRVRRRALLRRLQGEPGLCAGLRACGQRGRCGLHRPLRDERRRAAARGGRDRGRRGRRAARPAAGHPLPQRLRLRRGEHAGRRACRRHPGAGHGERLRRARGQHRPAHRGGRPGTEDGLHVRGRRTACAT